MRFEVHEFVCASGLEEFAYGAGRYRCGSRWVRPAAAAGLLGITPWRMWAAVAGESVPVDWRGWVSLDWVEGLLRTRARRAA